MADSKDINAAKRETMANSNYTDYLPPEEPEIPVKPKKKKLSKAEKKALKLQRQIEFAKLEKRDHLQRELQLSKRSAKRGQESWEDMCTEIKLVELKEELVEWNTKTQRTLHDKDEKIKMLLDDMGNTQEMHRRHFTRSLEIINYTTETYKTLLNTIHMMYNDCSSECLQDFYEELKAKKDVQDGFKENSNNVMYATNLFVERQLVDDYKIYLLKQDAIVNAEIEKRYIQRDNIMAKMRALQKQLTDFVYSLQNASLDVHKYERIHGLMEKQRIFYIESQKLDEVEYQSTHLLNGLQRDLLHMDMEKQRKLNDLRLEQGYFVQVHKSIEHDMALDRQITFDKLRILSTESYDVKKKFMYWEKMGELLLCLAANCRKLQTEAEKVLSFGEFEVYRNQVEADQKDVDDEEQYFKLQALDLKKHTDLSEEELLKQMLPMKPFWHRQSIVETQTMLLRKEKRKLVEDNDKYIDFIRSMTKLDSTDELPETLHVVSLMDDKSILCQQQAHQLKSHRQNIPSPKQKSNNN